MLDNCNLLSFIVDILGIDFKNYSVLACEMVLTAFYSFFCIILYIYFLQLLNWFLFSYLETCGTGSYPTDKLPFNLAAIVAETLGLSVPEESVSSHLVWQ